jgi:hypothetical protein
MLANERAEIGVESLKETFEHRYGFFFGWERGKESAMENVWKHTLFPTHPTSMVQMPWEYFLLNIAFAILVSHLSQSFGGNSASMLEVPEVISKAGENLGNQLN